MNVPAASAFVSSPVRNRVRIELKAPVPEVWALVGNHARFPEYSSGIARVEAKEDSSGTCVERICHFRPREAGGNGITLRELILWYEPNHGYATSAEEGNAFGLMNDVSLVSVEPSTEGTVMTWDQHYDAGDLDMMKADFDQGLVDIAERLIRRFGGKVVERYIES